MVDTNVHLVTERGVVLALVIPESDIRRLSLRPLKWLRYVSFALSGVHGDLCDSPTGDPVDYDAIAHEDHLAQDYYYVPHGHGEYRLIDVNTFNGRMTSSALTPRRHDFRVDIMACDGSVCLFTAYPDHHCDAAHILPRSKGDEYIRHLIQERCHLYNPAPEVNDIGINAVVNGLFLRKDLHSEFAHGDVAFLRTPNFALNCEDIPRVETGPIPRSRITMQYISPPLGYDSPQARDAHFNGTGNPPPEALLLDYMYGAAAYRRWGGGKAIAAVMQVHYKDAWANIPLPSYSPSSSSEGGSDPDTSCPPRPCSGRCHRRLDMSEGMLDAMDKIMALSMWLKGHTPQSIALEQERHEKEEMARAKEESRAKVQQWMQDSHHDRKA